DVRPPLAALLLATAAARPAAEQAAEQIAEVAELAEVEADAAAARIEAHAAVRRPVVVVGLALLGIREDVVSRLELLEALLRLRALRALPAPGPPPGPCGGGPRARAPGTPS